MKFELKVNKEQLQEVGKGAGKIGKAIIVEGMKAVALKGATAVITQSFDGGLGSVTDLGLDDVLKGGKKKPKGALFSFKKTKEGDKETLEAEVELDAEVAEEVVAEMTKPEKPVATVTKKAK